MQIGQDFLWGAASSSYQMEGSVNQDGKGVSIWDTFANTEGNIKNGDTGNHACGHYELYKEDVKAMKDLGLRAYRFSISWTRILPEGVGRINEKGLAFYSHLVDELIANGIVPIATLYHWDFPEALMKKGGWLNREVADWFAEYTKAVVDCLSDRVQYWLTINEPQCFVQLGYELGLHAPGIRVGKRECFSVAHHLLLAHGRAVQVIRRYAKLPPQIGYAPALDYVIPAEDTPECYEQARKEMFSCSGERGFYNVSWWMEPILRGSYPESGRECFAEWMPDIEEGDMEIISQPLDFFGFNYYHGRYFPEKKRTGYALTANEWAVVPEGIYYISKMMYEEYGLPVFITENGMACLDWVHRDGKVHDSQRIDYMARHISYMKKAMEEGVEIKGYLYWTLLDNFEWQEGYSKRFGLIYVDFETRERIWKDSAAFYRKVIESDGKVLEESHFE